MSEYAIHGGDEGQQRLAILSRTLGPSTIGFLKTAGLKKGIRCLDLGCGGGDVTLAIAEQIGLQGRVTGVDLDERKIQLASGTAAQKGIENVDFEVFNAYDLAEESAYDLVYSRFLLSHLSQPQIVLQKVWRALRPGGTILIEDTDFSGHFSYPVSRDFQRYVALYQRLLKKRGADANLGQKLVGLSRATGFVDVEVQISQPVHRAGEGKRMAEITFAGISKALVEEGLITIEEAPRMLVGLIHFRERDDSLISLPRIFQVCGKRP